VHVGDHVIRLWRRSRDEPSLSAESEVCDRTCYRPLRHPDIARHVIVARARDSPGLTSGNSPGLSLWLMFYRVLVVGVEAAMGKPV